MELHSACPCDRENNLERDPKSVHPQARRDDSITRHGAGPGNGVTTRPKVFELARELGLSSRELCAMAMGAGLRITSASRKVSIGEERAIREAVENRPLPRLPRDDPAGRLTRETAPAGEYGPCACCRQEYTLLVKARVPDGLPAKIRICVGCASHQGDHQAARDRRSQDHTQPH